MRVLIADSLQRFVRDQDIPPDIEVTLFPPAVVPTGAFDAIMPDITRRVGEEVLAGITGLRIIANYGAGYDNIDLDAAARRGIPVTNTPGALTNATAELTWALILAVARRVGEGERLVRAQQWTGWQPTHMLGFGLDAKTLGIVGAGRIGREVGRRARAFGMRVIYTGGQPEREWEAETRAQRVTLEDLLKQSDVVSLHVALNAASRRLIGARELGIMKRTAVLINTARGAIVDEDALVGALVAKRIRGAGLDVYANEPTVPAALRALDNVVLLPHLGSATEEARLAMWKLAWKNLMAGLRGEPLPNPVTP